MRMTAAGIIAIIIGLTIVKFGPEIANPVGMGLWFAGILVALMGIVLDRIAKAQAKS